MDTKHFARLSACLVESQPRVGPRRRSDATTPQRGGTGKTLWHLWQMRREGSTILENRERFHGYVISGHDPCRTNIANG